jgi:hypothetical protein
MAGLAAVEAATSGLSTRAAARGLATIVVRAIAGDVAHVVADAAQTRLWLGLRRAKLGDVANVAAVSEGGKSTRKNGIGG